MTPHSFSHRLVLAAPLLALLLAGGARAVEATTPVHRQVSASGLDLRTPEGAQRMYERLKAAARGACYTRDPVKRAPSWDYRACMEEALARAIGEAHRPLITQAFVSDYGAEAERYLASPTQLARK